MDLNTNSAGTKDWIRATRNMSISAYDPGQQQSTAMVSSTPAKRDFEAPVPNPSIQSPLPRE